MSRYIHKEYVYGFDRPLAQYFLDKKDKALVGPLSPVYGSNGAMVKEMDKEKIFSEIPEEHRNAILGDLEF